MSADDQVVVTGSGSGLGRAIHERFNGVGVTRATDLSSLLSVGTLIHCAVNTRDKPAGDTLAGWVEDNVILTRRLLDIPHRRFVYISSVDVYPEDATSTAEGARLDLGAAKNAYAAGKMMSEALVAAHGIRPLILRATALLGPHARPNSLVRMLTTPACQLGLSADSTFNYVHHDTVGDLIAIDGLEGILNVASTGNVRLRDIADAHAPDTQFGGFTYTTADIDNTTAAGLVPELHKTSEDVVDDLVATLRSTEGQAATEGHET